MNTFLTCASKALEERSGEAVLWGREGAERWGHQKDLT